MRMIRFTLAYGWLTITGTMHFLADVVWQYLCRTREPGEATTLYYCLNGSFALGQVALGALGLWLSLRTPAAVRTAPAVLIALGAAVGWLVLTFFMEYRQPRINAAIYLALVLVTAWPADDHCHAPKGAAPQDVDPMT